MHPQPDPASAAKIIAIAASAGGLKAISQVLADLPASLPAAVLVLQHIGPHTPPYLVELLHSRTSLTVLPAREGELISPGKVYVAPSDSHMRISPEKKIALTQEKAVHFSRPSVDVLFESLASVYGCDAIVVVLSGRLSDGSLGAQKIKAAGGTVIVQDEATADYFSMPESVIEMGVVDKILPVTQIGPELVKLLAEE